MLKILYRFLVYRSIYRSNQRLWGLIKTSPKIEYKILLVGVTCMNIFRQVGKNPQSRWFHRLKHNKIDYFKLFFFHTEHSDKNAARSRHFPNQTFHQPHFFPNWGTVHFGEMSIWGNVWHPLSPKSNQRWNTDFYFNPSQPKTGFYILLW